jgi:hypothetical protein
MIYLDDCSTDYEIAIAYAVFMTGIGPTILRPLTFAEQRAGVFRTTSHR